MQLYLVTRKGGPGWEEHFGAVIAANSFRIAKQIMDDLESKDGMAVNPEWTIETIGQVAHYSTKEGVVLASYNAG